MAQPAHVPLTAAVLKAVETGLADLAVRIRLRDYRAKLRTKLSKRNLFRVVLMCAQDSYGARRLWVEPPCRAHIQIHVRALLDRLAAEQLILPMDGSWPAFKQKNMVNVGAVARNIARSLQREAPDVALDTSDDPWILTVVLSAFSPAESFDPQTYVEGIRREIEGLVQSESFGTLTLQNFYPIQIGSRPWPSRTDEAEEPMVSSDITRLLADTGSLISVVADRSGAGKSTILRRIAYKAATDYASHQPGALLPIYLECSPTPFEDLAAAFTKHSGTLVDESGAKAIIYTNKCLFLMDAYDDMDAASRLRPRPITNLLAFSPMSRAIVTTRDTDIPALGQNVVYSVLAPADPVHFLSCHGVEQKVATKAVDDIREAGAHALLQTPIHLWLVARLLGFAQTEMIPGSPGGIVKAVVADILVPNMFKKPRAAELGFSVEFTPHAIGALGCLAHYIIKNDAVRTGTSTDVVESIFTDYFQSKRRRDAGALAYGLMQLAGYHSFLRKTDSGNYRFQHGLFLAFFAVTHVCSTCAGRRVTAIVDEVRELFGKRGMDALLLLEGLLTATQMNDAIIALARKDPLIAATLARFSVRRLNPQTVECLVAELIDELARFDRGAKSPLSLDFHHLVLAIAHLPSEAAMKALVDFMVSAKRESTIKLMPSPIARSRSLLAVAPLCALIDRLLQGGGSLGTDGNRKGNKRCGGGGRGSSRRKRRALLLGMAAQTLGLLQARGAVATLRKVALLPDESTAENAVLAMGWMRAEAAVPTLLELLQSAKSLELQVAVVMALGLIGNEEAAIALADLLGQDPCPTICTAIDSAFAYSRDGVALPHLRRVVEHPPSFRIFRVASEIIAEIGPKMPGGFPTERELEMRFHKMFPSGRDSNCVKHRSPRS